ncbi:hypothetical protein [Streptomyces sp. NPDC058548]|uniref:hypothetical protein n=1 Tax=Streptomyces sp. NPDC058548 TaxID=3346545 RepID=UPI0036567EAA
MITVYAAGYGFACFAGVLATETGDDLYAVALFSTSAGMLLGIHRECRLAARLLQVANTYRHGAPFPGTADDLARIERATAVPPDCTCETWWISLGNGHDQLCAADRTRKEPW